MRNSTTAVAAAGALALAGCNGAGSGPDLESRIETVSFEEGLGAWSGGYRHSTIIAGVFSESPATTEDLQPAFQGDTGHEQDAAAGLVWLRRSYDLTSTTGADRLLHLALGVLGHRPADDLLDNVEIVITPSAELANLLMKGTVDFLAPPS